MKYLSWIKEDMTYEGLQQYLKALNVSSVAEAIQLIESKRRIAIDSGLNPDIEIEKFHQSIPKKKEGA